MQTYETARHLQRDIWIETFAIDNFFVLNCDTDSLVTITASHRVFMQMKLFFQEKTLTVSGAICISSQHSCTLQNISEELEFSETQCTQLFYPNFNSMGQQDR